MRPLAVVALDEAIEACLLPQEILRGRMSSFLLERQVHALMTAVLLRAAGPDALDANPEPQPPHRQLAQAEEGAGTGKGHSVVGADGQGQPKVLKSPLKHGKCIVLGRVLQPGAA